MMMQIDLSEILAWGGAIATVSGGIWKFYQFSKAQAEREIEIDNKLIRLETESKKTSDELYKLVMEQKEIEQSRLESIEKMEEKFDRKLEKLDEKHSTAYVLAITEVKQMVNKTNEKIDKLMEFMINSKPSRA